MVVLALEYDPNFTGSVVLMPMAGMLKKKVENAGHTFFDRYERKDVQEIDETTSQGTGEVSDEPKKGKKGVKKEKEAKVKGQWGALKLSDALKDINLYNLLELEEDCPTQDIKNSYRKLVLKHHPDKQGATSDEDEKKDRELHFIRIQEAFEILSDEEKRRKYDSTLPFDDSIPSYNAARGDDFYAVFGPVFKRFARLSVKKPVPSLGDENTSDVEVKAFYEFWQRFQSWRDGMALAIQGGAEEDDLHDLETAECRMERRWMERENEKTARSYKREEMENIQKLVSKAESNDPRVLAEKLRRKEAREAEKKALEEARNRVQREREAAAQQKREEEERIAREIEAKKNKEKEERKAVVEEKKECRRRVRAIIKARSVEKYIEESQLSSLLLPMEKEELTLLADAMDATPEGMEEGEVVPILAKLIHAEVAKSGITPIIPFIEFPERFEEIPEEEEEEEEEEVPETPEERAAREAEEEKQRLIREEKLKKAAQQRAVKRAKEEKARRDAEAKAAQAAKKEAEKQRKEEERIAAEKEAKLAAQRQKAQDQSAKAVAESKTIKQEQDNERLAQEISLRREPLLDVVQSKDEVAIREDIIAAAKASQDLRAGIHRARRLLAKGEDKESMIDRLLNRISLDVSYVECGISAPSVKMSSMVRNKAKKCRPIIRSAATWVLEDSEVESVMEIGSNDESTIENMTIDIIEGRTDVNVPPQKQIIAAEATPQKGNKKKKGGKKEEESLDDILKDMGIEIPVLKKKKNKK